jgi:hypothetical protein
VTLCDSGPIVALLDKREQHHTRCREAFERFGHEPLVTTWPCMTEAAFLPGRTCGPAGREGFLKWWERGVVVIHELSLEAHDIIRIKMRQYADLPMSLADASLVAAAGELKQRHVLSVDSHLHIYRLTDGSAFDVIP